MNDLKIGVIGSGGRGVIAGLAHKPGEGSRIVACCDRSAATLELNQAEYGREVLLTTEYGALLEQDLDAVFISTPDYLHEEMAVAALQAGVAVYLEKPMAITTAGCDRVLKAAFESGAGLYVGHNMRHMVYVQKMKALVDGGAIGRVQAVWCRHFVGHGGDYYFRDWHAESRYSNGLLLQKGAHDIDVIHWLAGGYSRAVSGMGGLTVYGENENRAERTSAPRARPHLPENLEEWPPRSLGNLNHDIDVEDISMMQMQLDNGVFASYQQCHYTPDYWRNYTVIGDEGRLENFGNGEDGSCIQVWNRRKAGWGSPDEVHMVGVKGTEGHGGSDEKIVSEFLEFVRRGGVTKTSPVSARYSVAAGCAATESIRNGGIPVEVPEMEGVVRSHFEAGQIAAREPEMEIKRVEREGYSQGATLILNGKH